MKIPRRRSTPDPAQPFAASRLRVSYLMLAATPARLRVSNPSHRHAPDLVQPFAASRLRVSYLMLAATPARLRVSHYPVPEDNP